MQLEFCIYVIGRLSIYAAKEDPTKYLLMHAIGANVAGQIGSVLAGGILVCIGKFFGRM